MIQTLPHSAFERIRPLFASKPNDPILNGIVQGHNNGRIYVNDLDSPSCALVWAEHEIFYLIGEPQEDFVNALPAWIEEEIAPEGMRIGDNCFQVELLPEANWQEVVEKRLELFLPKPYTRVTFTFDSDQYVKLPQEHVPEKVSVERLTSALLAEEGLDDVRGMVGDFWRSEERFLQHGVGYVVRVEGKVACVCLTVYASDTDVEIGIETYYRSHRGRGFGRLAARAAIDECLRQSRTPHWKTEDFRLPSIRLAQKIGFTDMRTYTAYVFFYNEHDNLAFTAYHHLRYGHDLEAAEHFVQRAQTIGDLKEGHHFLLACGYSLSGEVERAYEHMKQALSLGWDGLDDVQYDIDLKRLRELPKGKALLESYEAARG